mgnify:CR=1 FL=1
MYSGAVDMLFVSLLHSPFFAKPPVKRGSGWPDAMITAQLLLDLGIWKPHLPERLGVGNYLRGDPHSRLSAVGGGNAPAFPTEPLLAPLVTAVADDPVGAATFANHHGVWL